MAKPDPDASLEHTTDELADRLSTLEGHIDDASDKAEDLAKEKTPDGVGDFDEVHDESGGEDPSGAGRAKDDPVR